MPSFKALAVLFSDLQNSDYVKQHNVDLPFNLQVCVRLYVNKEGIVTIKSQCIMLFQQSKEERPSRR